MASQFSSASIQDILLIAEAQFHLDLDLPLIFFDLYWWDSHYDIGRVGVLTSSLSQPRKGCTRMVTQKIQWQRASFQVFSRTRLLGMHSSLIKKNLFVEHWKTKKHQRKESQTLSRYAWQRWDHCLCKELIKARCFPVYQRDLCTARVCSRTAEVPLKQAEGYILLVCLLKSLSSLSSHHYHFLLVH